MIMHGFYHDFFVWCVNALQIFKPSRSLVRLFCFCVFILMIMLGSKLKKIVIISSCQQKFSRSNIITINLKICRTTKLTKESDGKRLPNCVKTHKKNQRNIFFIRKVTLVSIFYLFYDVDVAFRKRDRTIKCHSRP